MTKEPTSKSQPSVYEWYVFVLKAGSVERCIGTRLQENEGLLEVYDQCSRNFSVQKSEILDNWQQDRRVTKVGQKRIKDAFQDQSAKAGI